MRNPIKILKILIVSVFWYQIIPVCAFAFELATVRTIESNQLKVTLDQSFPRIIQYNWTSGGDLFYGQEDVLSQVKINGQIYKPEVLFSQKKNIAWYELKFNDINVSVKITVEVKQNIVDFKVAGIVEKGEFKVNTFEIPDQNLISVRSTQSGASFAGARMYTKVDGSGDTFSPVNNQTAADSIPSGYLFAILNSNQLAASLWSNSVGEKSDDGRLQKQTVKKEDYVRTGVWSGSWIYRAEKMKDTDPLPEVRIVITPDANNDKLVDWQDGAIAFRKIMNNPMGSDKIPDLVVQRIPMNFASQATNPFTKTLDETKRMYLNTDGLGQFVILKGYGSEGHDSGHPDYGDVGKRQGGATDMEMLCKAAQKYNAFMGVHINGTESYPEAKAFNDTLVNPKKKGWDWLDASYYIDKRYDAVSGNRLKRLRSLKDQVPSLNFIYCDVWYARGSWDSRKLAREIHSLGLTLATEFPTDHEFDAVWNHWAVDYNYGGKNIKGFNSQIVRFIRNHQKDTWIARHPLLGGCEMKDFEGWQGRSSLDSCVWMTFRTDLPTKYLQHFPIVKWDENSIGFEKNVWAKLENGKRVILKDGIPVLKDETYLLPWNPLTEDKLYHWSPETASTSWTLPLSWKNCKSVWLYKLSDQGRSLVAELPVSNRQITISADSNTPYVIFKKKQAPQLPVNWGEGTVLKDPGFNNGDLAYWQVEGNGAQVVRNERGQYELNIQAGGPVSVSQQMSGLAKGTYCASVYVSVDGDRKAILGVRKNDGTEKTNYCNSSLWKNYIAADSKSDKTMQRMYVFFDVADNQMPVTLFLKAEKGEPKVVFDDVRVRLVQSEAKADSIYFRQDFENVPDGLYPFVKSESGGINDPRTHLSELHAPYTQKGWNDKPIDDVIDGNWSLKAHGEPAGLLLQTIPQTLRFVPGRSYTISFKYEASGSDYALVIGEGITGNVSVTLNSANVPTLQTFTFTAGNSGNSWFGIKKLNDLETDLVLDDLVVTEK